MYVDTYTYKVYINRYVHVYTYIYIRTYTISIHIVFVYCTFKHIKIENLNIFCDRVTLNRNSRQK